MPMYECWAETVGSLYISTPATAPIEIGIVRMIGQKTVAKKAGDFGKASEKRNRIPSFAKEKKLLVRPKHPVGDFFPQANTDTELPTAPIPVPIAFEGARRSDCFLMRWLPPCQMLKSDALRGNRHSFLAV